MRPAGRVKLVADLHKKVESRRNRRLESSHVIVLETDAPNKVIRAGFGEDFVTGVHSR